MKHFKYYRTSGGEVGSGRFEENETLLMSNRNRVTKFKNTVMEIIEVRDIIKDEDGYCDCITRVRAEKNYIEINGTEKMDTKQFLDYCADKKIVTHEQLENLGHTLITRGV